MKSRQPARKDKNQEQVIMKSDSADSFFSPPWAFLLFLKTAGDCPSFGSKMFLLGTQCQQQTRQVWYAAGTARCRHRRTWARYHPRDPTVVTILWQDMVLPGFLQIHSAVQTWFPDVALAAVRKVHPLIFTDSRASRELKWLLLFIKLMACFLWVSATAGSLILLRKDC